MNPPFETLRQDIRFGLRSLARNPGFTAVAVLILTLGVGANTAIFSVVKAVLLDPLPYADAGRLVKIAEVGTSSPEHPSLDYTSVRELRIRSRSFESFSAFQDGPGILRENGEAEMLRGLSVESNFFETLGVRMQLGRNILPEEQRANNRAALILSDSLWKRSFGADPHVLGRVLHLSDYHPTIVGVLPPSFKPFLKANSEIDPEMYYPIGDGATPCKWCQPVYLIGRLKPGVTLAEANQELNAQFHLIVQVAPGAHMRGARLALDLLPDRLFGRTSTALWSAWCAAGFVLLIACANVANLLLARATGREREIAVRSALGAGCVRIVRQLLTESLLLAFTAGLLGTCLAYFGVRLLASLAPAKIIRAQTAHVDSAVLLFALAATVVAGLLFGLVPAWRVSRVDLNRAMKGANSNGRTHNGFRNALAIAEIAMAFVLAVGAGLMAQTFWRLTSVDAGFDPHNVLTLTTSAGAGSYASNRLGYYREMLDRLRVLPGIEGVAFSSLIPMDYTDRGYILRENQAWPDDRDVPSADRFSVSTDYFRVMRMQLKAGRIFTEQDTPATTPVALINETCARNLFAHEDPIEKRIRIGMGHEDLQLKIVGVVADVRQDGLDHPADMQVYMAENQKAIIEYYRMLARTTGDPMAMEQAVRSTFHAVDPGSPVYHVKSLEAYFSGRIADRTFAFALLLLLGILAVVLAAAGIYGVISYSAALRIREVGIRMALGAGRGQVLTLIIRDALPTIGAGLALGLIVSAMLTHLLANLLFEVPPHDWATVTAVAALLGSVALGAAALPAHRASCADPMLALRSE
jgi:putative ABC transport system permease protein